LNGISAAVDDAGRVMLWHPISGAGLFLFENGQRQLLVPYNGQVLDVPELSNAAPLDATDDGFFFQFGSRYDSTVLARWRQGAWNTLIEKQDLAASGGQINNISRGRANSRGDLALYLQWNGNSGLLVRMADGSMRSVVTIGDLLPDGSSVAEVTDFDFRDDGRLYLMIRDFDDRVAIYVAEPLS
jgi:hypothetical protein